MPTSLQDHLEKIHAFSVVARTGSFRKAATVLRRTQPSLSRSVKILEEVVGQPLLTRTRAGVHLTPAGQTLLNLGAKITAELGRVEYRLRSRSTGVSARLFIGSYESLAIRLWPRFIHRLTRAHPGIVISLKTDCAGARMLAMVKESELDIALSISPRASLDLIHRKIYSDTFALYCSPAFARQAFPGAKDPELAALQRAPFVLVPTATYGEGQTLEHLAWNSGYLSTQPVHELDSFEAAKEFLIEGVGAGMLPRWVAQPAVESGKLREIHIRRKREPTGAHTIFASYRKADADDPAILAVISAAEAFFAAEKIKP